MRPSRRLFHLFIAGGFGVVSAQTLCGSTRITSQVDADQVSGACATLEGDIVIEQSAKGNIRLDGIKTIKGALRSDGSSSIESLSGSTLESISGDFSLQGLEKLTSLSFPELKTIGGDLRLDTLTKVENITFSNLTTVANFNLTSAPALTSLDINKLTNISASDSSFTLTEIGIDTIVNIFAAVRSAVFQRNDFLILEFENMTITDNLTIVDNPNVGVIRLPNDMSSTTWDTIEISNNPMIGDQILYHDMSSQWPWGIKHIRNMTFLDTGFSSEFFETSAGNGERVDPGIESIGSLVVESDNIFNCSTLDSLRIKGVVKGEYECQGKTIAIGGDTKDNSSSIAGLNMIWVVVGLTLHGLFMNF